MGKKAFEVVGAIDVGTHYLHLTIAQVSENGKMEILEDLTKPTSIGNEAFTTGRISISTMHNTADTLLGFARLLKEYKVKHYQAFAKSALREAENREYVLEYIRIRTGIPVKVINNAEERFYMYKALRYHAPKDRQSPAEESTLAVNISSGGFEISVFDKGNLTRTEYINIGALRIHETLGEFRKKNIKYHQIIEEYLNSKLTLLKPMIRRANLQHMVGLGSEINTVCRKLSPEGDTILDKELIRILYEQVCTMHSDQLKERYNLTLKQLETFSPTVIILNSLLKLTKTSHIHVPMVVFRYGIIYDLADRIYNYPRRQEYLDDIIGSIWHIAKKYGAEEKHCVQVTKLALSLFDQTAKLHKLGEKERLYLQIAVILHSIGYFVSFSEHNIMAYELIKKQNIMGMSNHELEMIANIVRYREAEAPDMHHPGYQSLSYKERIMVSKLSVLLMLADSLDISHEMKISRLKVVSNKETAVFELFSRKNIVLEEWAFAQGAPLFEAIMGVRPLSKQIVQG